MTAVTVLIPAHNAAATLAATLDSLAAQTYRDFSVLIVDDASRDNTADIARGYSGRIAIEVLTLAQNAGVAGALNQGLATIRTPYIARLDADDLAMPTRLEKQVAFLEANPDVAVCSTWMELFYDDGRPSQFLPKPQHDAAIKTALVQYCSMSHGASMFRKSFFDDVGVFNTSLDFAEDYDLWTRGALLGKRYANLPEALSRYRQHDNRVGVQKRQLQYERDLAIKRKYISALLDGASPGHLAEFFSLLTAFSSKEIALAVVQQSMPLLLKLGRRLPDETLFGDIVSGCIGRHLR
ncbi:glycosyltransferase family 2 protein [Duganella callida]|uniref:Glycosyltransferase n=1 Tax=Duganella callida TaxID=2561932 RepID=A0A4Y9S795_9BURK|nr:glycosyltransferase [Duganella callida]TFW17129.1 glycosyltransferase [Duganella callida]